MMEMSTETMRMIKRILICAALVGMNITALSAAEIETRTHYVVANKSRMPLYRATAITTANESLATETYLFENLSGQRIRIDVRRNYKSRLVTAEYSLNDGKPVKVKLDLPGNASSRAEAVREYRERPELRKQDIGVTVESVGQVLRTGEKEWQSGSAEVRQKAKSIAGANLAATLKGLSPILGFPQFGGACSTYQFVSDGEQCSVNTELVTAIVKPDCAFDARFGEPCSNEQQSRAKQQPKNGKVGSY